MPSIGNGDVYTYGDYKYTYNSASNGWQVAINTDVINRNQVTYGAILESINDKYITNMNNTFSGCTKLTTAPLIPDMVVYMQSTFYGCTNLTGTVRINSSKVSNVSYILSVSSLNLTSSSLI